MYRVFINYQHLIFKLCLNFFKLHRKHIMKITLIYHIPYYLTMLIYNDNSQVIFITIIYDKLIELTINIFKAIILIYIIAQ